MATLAGQRAQLTWSLNQYNLAEDAETRAKYAKQMAKYIAAAPANGFRLDEVTQGQIYRLRRWNNISATEAQMRILELPKSKRLRG
jgi:hypothetical protein